MRRTLPAALLALLVMPAPCLASPTRATDDWPMVRHDSRNTAYSPVEVAPPLRLAWRVRIGGLPPVMQYLGAPSGPVLCSQGVVCVGRWIAPRDPRARGTGEERPGVVLIGPTGRIVWAMVGAYPIYLSGRTLVVQAETGGDMELRCYDWRTRRLRWTYTLEGQAGFGGGYCHGGNVQGGLLYYAYAGYPSRGAGGKATLVAVDLKTGRPAATKEFEDGWWIGPPAVDGKHVYLGISHWVRALDAATLEQEWASQFVQGDQGGNYYPLAVGSLLAMQGWNNWASAVDTVGPQGLWKRLACRGSAHCLVPGPGGGWLLVEAYPDPFELQALEPRTGRVVWRVPMFVGHGGGATCAGSGRLLYVPGHHAHLPGQTKPRGGFYCFDGATGKPLWRYERDGLQGVAIIVAQGSVYGLGSDGWLYRFVPVHPPAGKAGVR